jgi:glutathione peroxidase
MRLYHLIPEIMKKLYIIPILFISIINCMSQINPSNNKVSSFFDFKTKTIDGKDFSLSSLKGKKVLVVNTASLCGNTPQYKDLESLYKKYGGDKFVIIGFPANNFAQQEPGSNTEIQEFCTKNYGVTFPMMSKISVKGDDTDPIYKWLTTKALNGKMDSQVKWNFQKYLINENGQLVAEFDPKVNPLSDDIIKMIK